MPLAIVCCVFCLSSTLLAVHSMQMMRQMTAQRDAVLGEFMQLTAQAQADAIVKVAEAIGGSVQTALQPSLPPPLPPPNMNELRQVVQDAMIRFEQPDMSDPTDGAAWLQPERDSVAMIDPNDPEPYGIPGLRNMHLPPPDVAKVAV